jgi:hypothetical protein
MTAPQPPRRGPIETALLIVAGATSVALGVRFNPFLAFWGP